MTTQHKIYLIKLIFLTHALCYTICHAGFFEGQTDFFPQFTTQELEQAIDDFPPPTDLSIPQKPSTNWLALFIKQSPKPFKISQRKKSNKTKFPCPLSGCNKTFTRQSGAYEHAQFNCRENRLKTKIICPALYCNRTFSSPKQLSKHYSYHPNQERINPERFTKIVEQLRQINRATMPWLGKRKHQKNRQAMVAIRKPKTMKKKLKKASNCKK